MSYVRRGVLRKDFGVLVLFPKCSKVAWKRKHDEEKRQLELDKIVSNMPKSKEYISITEAYAMFGACRSTIYRLIYMKNMALQILSVDNTHKSVEP